MRGFKYSDFLLKNRDIVPPENLGEIDSKDYIDKADESTFIYDCFSYDGRSILISPPMNKNEIVELYQHVFFGSHDVAKGYYDSHKQESFTTQAYTRVITNLDFIDDRFDGSLSLSLIKLLSVHSYENIAYTLQKNNPIEWIVDWAIWQVNECGAELVVIYDNQSVYNIKDIEEALSDEGINNFVMSVPYKYGPSWGHSNTCKPWGAEHLWLQRACLEHIRMICRLVGQKIGKEILVLNTDIDELLHIPKNSDCIFQVLRSSSEDVAHFIRLPVYPEKNEFDKDKIFHHDHVLIKKEIQCQSPKHIFNASSLDIGVPMHQHVINRDNVRSIQYIDIFASHCIGINTGWKYWLDGMINGWVQGENFFRFELDSAIDDVFSEVASRGVHLDWEMSNDNVRKIKYPIK